MILSNFTPDAILWMHSGIDGVMKPGDITEFPDNRARHILNKFDKRGVLQLTFGDDPEKKRAEAMVVWRTFWERQITIFNQDNERRKNTNKEYAEPTAELKAHAQKLGIELVGPWSIKKTDNAEVEALKSENAEMKSQLSMLMGQMKELTAALQSQNKPEALRTVAEKIELSKRGEESRPTEEDPKFADTAITDKGDDASIIKEFSKLDAKRYGEWVMTNLDRIDKEFSPAVKTMIREKWERLIKGEFPIPD